MTGAYKPLYSDNQILAFFRQSEGKPGFLIALNLSHRPCYFTPERITLKGTVEIATYPENEGTAIDGSISLSGDEGVIIRLE